MLRRCEKPPASNVLRCRVDVGATVSVAARCGRCAGPADLWHEVKEFLENALEAFGSRKP